MNRSPQVSVIVPFQNAAEYLPRAFAGLEGLSGPIEIILVDDASTDNSRDLAAAFCRKDPRARLILRAATGGATRARMSGVEAANGEYVWFCDADDEWEPDIVDVLLREALTHQADLVACRAERIEADGRRWTMEGVERAQTVLADQVPALIWEGRLRGYLWNKLIRRNLIPTLRRQPLSSQDDFLMVLNALAGTTVVRLIPDVKYRYFEQAGSISVGSALRFRNVERCVDEAFRRLLPQRPSRRQQRHADAFVLWFYLVPAIATPVHRCWDKEIAERVRRELTPQISWASVARLATQQPSVAAHAALIRLGRRIYPNAYHLARRITRRLRAGD